MQMETGTGFRKLTDCPTSHELLAFQSGECPDLAEIIRAHLGECEFCTAELEFYMHYPQGNEPVPAPALPEPLKELAEALLNSSGGEKLLDRMVKRAGTAMLL